VTEVSAEELGEKIIEIVRRVEGGEDFAITLNGRRVARLVGPSGKRRYLPAEELLAHPADRGLLDDLREFEEELDGEDAWERAARLDRKTSAGGELRSFSP